MIRVLKGLIDLQTFEFLFHFSLFLYITAGQKTSITMSFLKGAKSLVFKKTALPIVVSNLPAQ